MVNWEKILYFASVSTKSMWIYGFFLSRIPYCFFYVVLHLILVMIVKKFLFASLSLTLCFVSFLPVFGAQTATSVTDKASQVGFPMENRVVSQYLQDAATKYGSGIGRNGTSILCYWLLGAENSPYLFEVEESKGESRGKPNFAEQCAPVSLAAVKGGFIQVSSSPTFSKKIEISVKSDSAFIYNLVPQTVYWYKVFDANGKQVSNGIFKTLGRVRMIRTEKVLNVRDIGGWKCDGGRFAYGKIYRGAALDGVTVETGPISSSDIKEFKNVLGISTEIDLRGDATLTASPLGSGVTYKKIGLVHYKYLLENTEPQNTVGSGDYYAKLASLFDYIVSTLKAGKGIYLHCTWGADRTGTVLALIEALCGVSEANIVKEWELTSFNAAAYRKYINIERLKYEYKDSNGNLKTQTCELRSVFNYLYKNHGGSSGASLKTQVTRWLQSKVFANRSDKGASVINELRSLLITPDIKSPVIIKDLSKEMDSYNYSVTTESTSYFNSVDSKYIVPTTGKIAENDAVTCTDYISCSGYSYLLLSAPTAQIGAFYDANKKYLGSIEDATVSNNYGTGTVLFDYRQYSIPAKAAYVKLNMPKYCDWEAVLSETPYL